MFENLIIAILASIITLYMQHLIKTYSNWKIELFNNIEKILLAFFVLFILIIVILSNININIKKLDESTITSIISISGALISGVVASYATVALTNRKEKKIRKRNLKNLRITLCNYLEKNVIEILGRELEDMEAYYKIYQHRVVPNFTGQNRTLLEKDIFNIFPGSQVLDMCMEYKLDFGFMSGVLQTIPDLYNFTIIKTDAKLKSEIESLRVYLKLESILNNPVDRKFIQEENTDLLFEEYKRIIEGRIRSFKTYISNVETIISDLSKK